MPKLLVLTEKVTNKQVTFKLNEVYKYHAHNYGEATFKKKVVYHPCLIVELFGETSNALTPAFGTLQLNKSTNI